MLSHDHLAHFLASIFLEPALRLLTPFHDPFVTKIASKALVPKTGSFAFAVSVSDVRRKSTRKISWGLCYLRYYDTVQKSR